MALARPVPRPLSALNRYCAFGSPADCVETIAQFVEAGAHHVAVIPTVPPARVPDELARVAEDIVPAFARPAAP